MYEKGRLDNTARPRSLAPSYRLSDLDVSQLARELLVMQEDASPAKQRTTNHGEGQEVHEEGGEVDHDPFGDDTYAIGDEEVDNIVGVLRDSRDMADNSTSQVSQSVNGGDDDFFAIGDEEVDGVLDILRTSREIHPVSAEPRSRQAWVEDREE